MSPFSRSDLTRLLRESAGEAQPGLLDGDVLDVTFSDLGYDSVAVLQLIGLIERERDIQLADETVSEAQTPRALLELVNSMAGPAAA
ncbi:acyl carrier protein [Streptomyces canus]|uniref:acyl carrier protein n=1 Tax=Streptomyces canus TaxID=58343 RepID=UPI00225657A9|nr:acyl carrier protein [Streptomyces canus]MCX5261964.1 acyl carrier protein [Streptomyces canus]